MNGDVDPPPPAFYALSAGPTRGAWADWWVLLHPPYTLWHLSYVAIGASVAPQLDGARLAATLIAFFLAVGVGAHALDELQGRPLRTKISNRVLTVAAALSISSAVAIGIIGISQVGLGLAAFIVVGVALNLVYNLELFGGRLHNDITFAAAWGSFPVLTGYYAQAETLSASALLVAAAAYWLSVAQRSLSTPARTLRRHVTAVDGTITYNDAPSTRLSRPVLMAPLEAALKAIGYAVVLLALALVLYRSSGV